jgi:hypothetical protein
MSATSLLGYLPTLLIFHISLFTHPSALPHSSFYFFRACFHFGFDWRFPPLFIYIRRLRSFLIFRWFFLFSALALCSLAIPFFTFTFVRVLRSGFLPTGIGDAAPISTDDHPASSVASLAPCAPTTSVIPLPLYYFLFSLRLSHHTTHVHRRRSAS